MSETGKTLRSIDALAEAGLVVPENTGRLEAVAARYAIAVTPAMARLMAPGDADDPIARQFVPDARELETTFDEMPDPIGDAAHEKVPGLIHRYRDRVLLKVTATCPVYCRFCFRREMVGPGNGPGLTGEALDRALAYIRDTPAIWEVILTGGDPLILAPRRIAELTRRLEDIPHVAVVRWHTRVPVVDPGRITDEMAAALASPSRAVYVGLHANHPRELTQEARAAIRSLQAAGIHLVSQTVLLKGVNADPDTLEALFRAFVALGIRPYYLHHGDLAPGTSHFRAHVYEGQALMRELRRRLSGLALPAYVLDIPGGHGKVPIGPHYIDDDAEVVADPKGQIHAYPPDPEE